MKMIPYESNSDGMTNVTMRTYDTMYKLSVDVTSYATKIDALPSADVDAELSTSIRAAIDAESSAVKDAPTYTNVVTLDVDKASSTFNDEISSSAIITMKMLQYESNSDVTSAVTMITTTSSNSDASAYINAVTLDIIDVSPSVNVTM